MTDEGARIVVVDQPLTVRKISEPGVRGEQLPQFSERLARMSFTVKVQ